MSAYYEYAGNMHIHTTYSDGVAVHAEIARAAEEAGLDFIITTDHNVWVDGCEGFYGKVLLLVGEEIHDVRRRPQGNHLLVYHAEEELAPHAAQPQALIDAAVARGGMAYLAHPIEYGSTVAPGLAAINWQDWDVAGYAGIELWNYMSEFKALLSNKLAALIYTRFPAWGISGPFPATLAQWDRLLLQGLHVAAIGGADAHGTTYTLGPLRRQVFPYAYLFRCVNTHILTPEPLSGVFEHDKELIYTALQIGHTFVGYDLLGSTGGFRFVARSGPYEATFGDELKRTGALVFEAETPQAGDIRLVCNGRVVARTRGQHLRYTTADPGVYRVEVYRSYQLGRRGWIFSSPIYVT